MAHVDGMWAAIEADFHREYGVDVSAPGVLRSVSWRWFVTRLGNLSADAAVRNLGQTGRRRHSPEGERQISDALARAAARGGKRKG